MNEWKFDNSNTRNLWLVLSEEDRKKCPYSLEKFDWKSYIQIHYHEIRKHILQEDFTNIERAVSKNKMYKFINNTVYLTY